MAGSAGPGAQPKFLRDLAATVTRVGPARGVVLYSVQIVNNQAAAIFIQLFNVSALGQVTLATTNPDKEINVAASASKEVFFPGGAWFPKGLFAASTTTEKGLTGSAAGVQVFFDVL
jgi:hypothetical protein